MQDERVGKATLHEQLAVPGQELDRPLGCVVAANDTLREHLFLATMPQRAYA